jgi:hypothetical protein
MPTETRGPQHSSRSSGKAARRLSAARQRTAADPSPPAEPRGTTPRSESPADQPTPPRIRRTDAARSIRGLADLTDTLGVRDHLLQLAAQVKAGAANPQRSRFVEAAISECLDDAGSGTTADRWLAAEAATWALGWMARARRAGGSAGGLLERLVQLARGGQELLTGGDTSSARFVLTLARLFSDIEACRRLEATASDAVASEIDRLVSARGSVNVATGGDMVRRVVRWTTCREVAETTGAAIWDESTERKWREAATAAVRLVGRHGRQVEGPGLMPLAFTAPLLAAVAALDGKRARTVKALIARRRAATPPARCLRLQLNDTAAAIATMRSGWEPDAIRVLCDYRQPMPRLEVAVGDRMLVEGPWEWTVTVDGDPLEPEAPWSVACWEAGRKASYLELTTPLPGGRQFERTVVLLPRDRVLLLADAVTTTAPAEPAADSDPDRGWLQYRAALPLAAGLEVAPAAETREIVVHDAAPRFQACPLALQEWRVPVRGGFTATGGCLRLAQESPGRRFYAPLWLDLDPARIGRPLTWRQLTVADTRQNLGPHQAAGFRVQAGLEQWLVYRSLDAPRNRTLLGCNVACDFLLGHIKPKGQVKRTLEIQ